MTARSNVDSNHSLVIAAPPARVVAAFFDPSGLATWWQAARSVTTPRPLGVYAIEWDPTEFRDALLGPLGGVFHGTVMDFTPARGFFVAGAYWLPPEGEPIGPMALDVSCGIEPPATPPGHPRTALRVSQTGYESSDRWERYYEVVTEGWQRALASLRAYLEQGGR